MNQPGLHPQPSITPRDVTSVIVVGWLTPYTHTVPFYLAILVLRNAAGGADAGVDQILWGQAGQVGLTGVSYLWIAFVLSCEFFAVYFFVIYRQQVTWRDFGLRHTKKNWLYLAVLAAVVLGLIDEALIYWLDLTSEADAFLVTSLLPTDPTIIDLLLAILMAGFAASFVEEFVFRSVLYRGLSTLLGIWPAAILSAALFSAVHMYFIRPGGQFGWLMSGDIFVFGLIAAILLEKSKSLWPCIMLHAVGNILYVIWAFWLL